MNSLLQLYPGDRILLLVVNVLVAVTLVILIAAIIAHFVARYDAALRHGLWLVTLLCVVASPVVVCTMHAMGISWIELPTVESAMPAVMMSRFDSSGSPVLAEHTITPTDSNAMSGKLSSEGMPTHSSTPLAVPERRARLTRPASSTLAPVARSPWPDVLRAASGLATLSWALGVLFFLMRLAHGWRALGELRRDAVLMDPARLAPLAGQVCAALGARQLPPIMSSATVTSPITAGLARPIVILPEQLIRKVSNGALCDVLVHEAAHIIRHDHLVGFAQRLAELLFWPYPLVYAMNRQLGRAREEVCDNYVLAYGDGPSYTQTLLALAEQFVPPRGQVAALGLLTPRWRLEDRVASLLDTRRNPMTRLNQRTMFVVMAFALLSVGVLLIASATAEITPNAEELKTEQTTGQPEKHASDDVALASSSPGMVLRRVLMRADGRYSSFSAPTPDGRYVACTDWNTGDVTMLELETGEARRLTNKGPWEKSGSFAEWAVLSKDSNRVAYSWYNDTIGGFELKTVEADGSSDHVLYDAESDRYVIPRAWTPDGKHILAVLFRKDHKTEIVFVSTADGSIRSLKIFAGEDPNVGSLSPDGRFLTYDHPPDEDSPNHDIYVLATDGSGRTQRIAHPANDQAFAWTPDGTKLLISSDRSGYWDVWMIDVIDGKPQSEAQLVKTGVGRATPMGFKPNGSFYYQVSTGGSNVYQASIDPDSGKTLAAPRPVTGKFIYSNKWPSWSPNGKQLAYVSLRRQTRPFLCIRSTDTDKQRELPLYGKLHPLLRMRCWSPDGHFILVGSRDGEVRSGIFEIDVRTGEVSPYLLAQPEERYSQPQWSGDGRAVFYVHHTNNERALIRHDVATGIGTEVYRTGSMEGLALSPDGSWIAFITRDMEPNDKKIWRLSIIPSTGGKPRDLTRYGHFEGGLPTWTADNRYLLYAQRSADRNRMELWRVAVESGDTKRMDLALPDIRKLSVHPDGKQIAFHMSQTNKTEVWVMENFMPKVADAR